MAQERGSGDHTLTAARLETILAGLPTGMLMVDREGRVAFANRFAARLFGYEVDELVGTSVDMLLPTSLQASHPEKRDAFFLEPAPRAVGAGRDLRARRKDGSEFPVEIGLNPVEGPEGLQVLASIVDLSERVRAVAEHTRLVEDVRQANRALEESNLELKQFAYIASHDLQTPLRGVSSFAEFLRQDYGESLDERANEYIDRIVDGARRMKQLIDDLLTYSRVESQAVPFSSVDLNQIVDEVVELFGMSIEEIEATVTREQLPSVLGNRAQITQLVQNLIGNGLKYHGDEAPHVHVSATHPDGLCTFVIRDNGIGIAEKHLERIFETFRRLHTQKEYPGTGIGLALCRRTVNRHGGRIWVESEEGQGSTFFVALHSG